MSENQPEPADPTPYRQPMITSLGIMMGFLLNFLANWAVADDDSPALNGTGDYLVAGTLVTSIAMMCWVIARVLDIRKTGEAASKVYLAAYRTYVAAIVLALVGLASALLI